MFCKSDDSFHNIFISGEWNVESIKTHFGDAPAILTDVLKRRSCTGDVIKLLLQQGADVNYKSECGYSPLMTALEISNDPKVIRELLEGGADVNELDEHGRHLLFKYLQREDCSVGIVEALLDFKASVNRKVAYGDLPMRMATFAYGPLASAIRKAKDEEVIRVLVERGAEVNDTVNLHNTPLLVLLRERNECSVDTVKFLLANGADINCVDACGCSPLGTALHRARDGAVIQALLERGANVNMVCNDDKTPLLIYLGHHSYTRSVCSVAVVKLLLRYKANVNSVSPFGDTPLMTALKLSRSKEIIRVLLENGADLNALDRSRGSPLCIALRHSPTDIVKLLLEAGSSLDACEFHTSALFCATDFPYAGLNEGTLNLLFERNVDMNGLSEYGESVMCYALRNGAKAHVVQLLLNAGASLNACEEHSSPLVCITRGSSSITIRADVVQLLLDNGASVGDKGLKILQDILFYFRYETRAIQLLLDLPGMDAYVVSNECSESLLHLAVQSSKCRRGTIELLINKNARVDSTNENGETPLHCALKNPFPFCDLSIINLLLQNGSPVNALNRSDETPLMLAVRENRPVDILRTLLMSGAHIGKSKFCIGRSPLKYELLEFLARRRRSEMCDDSKLDTYKILIKFFLLQNPECNLGDFQCYHAQKELVIFMNKCLGELGEMNSMQVGPGHTFRMFVSRDCLSVEKMYDVNQILICLMKNTFPVYFDVISAKIGRSIMEAEIKKLQVYTSKICPDLLYGEKILLNSDVVVKISQYLPDDDLLNLILVFYKPVLLNKSKEIGKNDSLLGKRNSEPSSQLHKHQKLNH